MSYFSRITSLQLGSTTLADIKSFSFKIEDPYILISIPAGTNVYQFLKQQTITGKFICLDEDALYDTLQAEGFLTFSTGVRNLGTAVLTVRLTDGNPETYTFSSFRVETIEIDDLKDEIGEIPFTVVFTAKSVAKA